VLPFEPDRAELATLLASADIYLTAAAHETFGLAVLEAQASGLPVIGVRAGAMVERVGAELGILGEPGSAGDLARNVALLAANGMRAKGRAARAHVERLYSWDATFGRLIARYEDLVRRGAA
jgi:glycosyltransferase involved in cell wall biosynthesis